MGGVGSGSTNWFIWRSIDNNGTAFWELMDDHSASVANHRLRWRNDSGFQWLEFDASGEMRLMGSESTEMMFLDTNADVVAVRNDATLYLEQTAANPNIIGHGQFYVEASDDSLHYVTEAGVDFDLTAGGAVPGGADTNIQFNDSGAFGGDASFTWDNVTKQLLINQTGSTLAAIRILNLPTARIAIQIGGSGSSTQRWEIFRSTDSSGAFSWILLDDHLLSSGNHKLQFRNQDSDTFLEMDNSGEMSLGGIQGTEAALITGIGGTLKWKFQQSFFMEEQAAAAADVLTEGQFWVRNDDPNVPMFTDDLGTDFVLNASGGITATPTPVVNDIAVWDSTGATLGRFAGFEFDGTVMALPTGSGIQFDGGITDKIILFGTLNNATSYGSGIEASTHYFKSQSRYRWYSGQNADGGVGDIMTLEAGGQLITANAITATLGDIESLAADVIANQSHISGTAEGDGHWLEGGKTIYGMFLSAVSDVTFGGRPLGDTNSDLNFYFSVDLGTNRGFVFKTNGPQDAAVDMTFAINPVHGLLSTMPLKILERSAALADTLTMGQIWVLDEGFSQSLMFTNDNGNDFELAALNLTDMNTGALVVSGTGFVEALTFQPDINRNYMINVAFEVNSPASDDMNVEMVIDTNAVFKGVLTFSNQAAGIAGNFALESGIGDVITNIVTVPTDGSATPAGTYVTIVGCLRMGATSGTHSVRVAKNANVGGNGQFEATAALQASVLQVS
jgi:hypothetical protein